MILNTTGSEGGSPRVPCSNCPAPSALLASTALLRYIISCNCLGVCVCPFGVPYNDGCFKVSISIRQSTSLVWISLLAQEFAGIQFLLFNIVPDRGVMLRNSLEAPPGELPDAQRSERRGSEKVLFFVLGQ